ncbi:MAG: ATP-binding protein [Pyrinomonadaceae bacterium]|nr:ATP-binding protein [Pyrinomonadaceae bacterium]
MGEKIISTVSAGSFIGRADDLDILAEHARKGMNGMVVASKPAAGASELLRQSFDLLFVEQGETIPFLFELSPQDRSVRSAAIRYLQTFLVQFTAFRRNESQLAVVTPDVCELNDLSAPSDTDWLNRLVDTCRRESELNDEASFVRHALSAPLRAFIEDFRVVPIIGGLEHAGALEGNLDFFEMVKESCGMLKSPFILEGKRRFISAAAKSGVTILSQSRTLHVDSLDQKSSADLCLRLSDNFGVETSAQTRDLISLQLEGSPVLISGLFHSAAERDGKLDSFRAVEKVYIKELLEGRIRGYFDSGFDSLAVDSGSQRKLVDLIYGARTFSSRPSPTETWASTLKQESDEFSKTIALATALEFVDSSSNLLSAGSANLAFEDYLESRFRLEVERAVRASVYGDMLAGILKRAPKIMAGFYRQESAIGLRDLLSVFNCQETPLSLLFYNVFKQLHKGKSDEEIAADLKNEPEQVSLPQIVYSVNTVSVYGRLSKFTDKERSAVAIGFEAADYTDESETVWIAAEIESKLEAEADLTEFWCDRLEMVALMGDYNNFRIWLISPEGFSPDAIEVLKERNAIGSSRKQVELLARHLEAGERVGTVKPDNAFELVVPMGEDTELIAAHAVEEIARRHSFGAKAINQIKTALVEACINATEHSKSPDRKIYQRFEVEDDRIVVTISNRGLRFKGEKAKEIMPTEGRRGWGLKLMKTLMDEVRFEQVDDGTRISMTKMLNPA